MWLKRILQTAGVLVCAVLGFGCTVLLVRWLLSRREKMEAAHPAIEIDIEVPTTARKEPDEREPATPSQEAQLQDEQETFVEDASDAESASPDDLERIRGIGPKIASVLQEAGITTFAQLADSEVDEIRQILGSAGPRLLQLTDPTTWPEQAELAAEGKWEALDAL